MTSVIPYLCCIILFCCLRNGWSQQHLGETKITNNAGRTKQTGYRGDSLIIESETTEDKWSTLFSYEPIPNQCTRLGSRDYKNEYGTNVLNRPIRIFKVDNKQVGNIAVDLPEYFIHVKTEAWSCNPAESMENKAIKKKPFKYLRIVNEMVSIKEIYEIKYNAGVDVSLVNFFENEIRVKVEETRCFAQRENKKFELVQCEPVKIFYSQKNLDPVIPNLLERYVVSHKENNKETSLYNKDAFDSVGDANIKKISNKGKSLKIGSIPTIKNKSKNKEKNKGTSLYNKDAFNSVGNAKIKKIPNKGKSLKIGSIPTIKETGWLDTSVNMMVPYECRLKRGVSPLLFTPEVYLKIDIGDSKSSYAKITQDYFSKLFTIVDRQVHDCSCHTKPRRVYRVLNTIIGKTEIRDVINEPGILELYVISLPNGGKSIRFTTLEFFYADTRERAAYDDVYYTIHFPEDRHSTWSDSKMKDPLPDIFRKLGERTVFRTLINPKGFNLRVGSRIMELIGLGKPVQCTKKEQKEYLDQFNTVVKLIVVEDDAFHTEVIDDDKIPIEYTSKEFWLCTNEKEKVEFYRIVNKFNIPASIPVHEIESVDGVEILIKPLDDGRTFLEIVEVKYMDFQNNAVFHLGRMDFENGEIFSSFEASQLPNAVTKNEIFPLIVDLPMRNHNSTDPFVKDGDENHEFNIDAKGNAVMDFIVKVQEEEEPTTKSLYICKLEENNYRTLLPYFMIKSKEDKKIDELKNAEDSIKNSKYFENIDNKVWTCKYENSMFYRVVNKQSLRKKISGTTAITKICHTDMDKAWFEITSDDKYVVKMEGVRHAESKSSTISGQQLYPNLEDNYLINSEGHFMLFEEKPRTGAWKSGTQELKQETDFKLIKSKIVENIEMKETDYDFSARELHKVPFSGNHRANKDNPSLRIGSKWSIHKSEANLRCTEDKTSTPEQSAKKEFLPKVVSIRGEVVSAEDAFQDFFLFHSQRTWNCINKMGPGRKIIRVVNMFKFIDGKLDQVDDIFYHDEIKVIIEEVGNKLTLEMLEVKYIDSESKEVMRFDTILQAFDEEERPMELKNSAIVDVDYNLNENEKYRSNICLKGVVLEVGQRYESTYVQQAKNDARFLRIKCDEVESKDKVKLLKVPDFNTAVMIIEESRKRTIKNQVQFHPVKMNVKTFQEYLQEKENEIFLCSEIDSGILKKFYRVVRKFIISDQEKHSISHVYHYDGVTIHGKRIIQEIKYLSKDDKGKYQVMRFDGFVVTNDKIGLKSVSDYISQREILYEKIYLPLFRKILHTAHMQEDDVTYEVQSHWDVEIRNYENDVITCIRKETSEFNEICKTEVYSNSVPANDLFGPNKWDEIPTEEHFFIQEQDVWHCERNGRLIFKRYVNKLYKTDSTTVRVYYPAGVSVEAIKLPDDKKFLQITQVKLLDVDNKRLVKYVGKVRLVSEVLPGAENFLINYSNNYKESRRLKPSNMPFWPLDIMRVFANSFISFEAVPRMMMDVKYKTRDTLQTQMVDDKAERVFKIGTPWEEEVAVSNGQFRCIFDEWNSIDIFKYTPRVVEYVDGSLYQLDDVAFHQVFKIENINVYICRNQKRDEFLRLDTVLQGKIPILAVRYGDGVTVKIIKDEQVEITEAIYMDVRASRVLKFTDFPRLMLAPLPSRSAQFGKKIRGSITRIRTGIRP